MIERLTRWATDHPDVRALILTSTRAVPGAQVDAYSDFDVIVVVPEVRPWVEQSEWLGGFGEVLVAYWDPIAVDPVTGTETVGSIVNLAAELDAGYRVLVDKDDLTADWSLPTFRGYVPERPDRETFDRLVTDFLIGVPYVAKGLLRDELLPMKWVLDFDMRHNYLVPMLSWSAECEHDWQLPAGNLGRGLRGRLSPDVWSELEQTFVGADPDENWTALFAMVALFDRVARDVADALGFPSPADRIATVGEHAQRMRVGDFAAGPLESAGQ